MAKQIFWGKTDAGFIKSTIYMGKENVNNTYSFQSYLTGNS